MLGDPWILTAELSPRPSVRLAAVDAYGQALNNYPITAPIDGPIPVAPWAVNLADVEGRFWLLAFDFDAKQDRAVPARDAVKLARYLTEAGISHVVCASGPSGGRHVWVVMAEPASAELVADLASLVAAACPSLDRTPLVNPATGCVRPPGSPHRDGGASVVIAGDLAELTSVSATTTTAQLLELAEDLNRDHPLARTPSPAPDRTGPLPVELDGTLYLPGPRRDLPGGSRTALEEPAADSSDASAVLWRVLIGAAAARWRYSDIARHLEAPGLEHARTRRVKGASLRRSRPTTGPQSPERVLRAEWQRAVTHVASSNRQVGSDPTFEPRAAAIAAHVDQVQTRADASAGRWARGGGPADRRILDALSLLALQAVSASIEANVRHLGNLAGCSQETARKALLRLAADGWIQRTRGAEGHRAAHWTIDPQNAIHREANSELPQAFTRPAGLGSRNRSDLLGMLTERLEAFRHDVFTHGGALGFHAGNTYARVIGTMSIEEVAGATTQSPEEAYRTLKTLAQHGLIRLTPTGWERPPRDSRDEAAERLGVSGRLAARAETYAVDRVLWGWWQAEVLRLSSPGRNGFRKKPAGAEQQAFVLGAVWDRYPAYPRTLDRRPDHRAARDAIRAGLLPQFYALAA